MVDKTTSPLLCWLLVASAEKRKGRHQKMFHIIALRVLTRKGHSLSIVIFIGTKLEKGTKVCELLNEARSTQRNHLLRGKHGRSQALLR
jgi:hypothetical protein